MLEEYARKNGLPNPTYFTDNGISGTRFDRPGFTAMMEEVEARRVEAIVVKKMSRLGRDYLKIGQVMEILRQQGVRQIFSLTIEGFDPYQISQLLKQQKIEIPAVHLARPHILRRVWQDPIGTRCKTQHRINASVVLTLIADMLKAIADYSKNDRAEFIKTVQEAQQATDITKKKRRL